MNFIKSDILICILIGTILKNRYKVGEHYLALTYTFKNNSNNNNNVTLLFLRSGSGYLSRSR